jgi:hypothetical protein
MKYSSISADRTTSTEILLGFDIPELVGEMVCGKSQA